MPIRTKRWNDPVEKEDGLRILITRFRPRALPKGRETWAEWRKQLAPSAGLLADFQGKDGPPIDWATYRERYLVEMQVQVTAIEELAGLVKNGESVTLLCASTCEDPAFCHRTLLARLIAERAGIEQPPDEERTAQVEAKTPERKALLDWLS